MSCPFLQKPESSAQWDISKIKDDKISTVLITNYWGKTDHHKNIKGKNKPIKEENIPSLVGDSSKFMDFSY